MQKAPLRANSACSQAVQRPFKNSAILANILAAFGLCVMLGFVGGCATLRKATTSPPAPEVEEIKMDPVHVVARFGPDGLLVESYDAQSLFNWAVQAFEERKFADAEVLYRLLLEEFPGSRWERAAQYNLGLALEALDRYDEAIKTYQALLDDPGLGDRDRVDTLFRVVECHEVVEAWEEAEATLRIIAALDSLTGDDRVEAHTRLGNSYFNQERYDEAELAYRNALSFRATDPPRPLLRSTAFLARAQYGLAEVERMRFENHPIRLPEEVMQQDIGEKARLFLRAQANYFRTMTYPEKDLVVAAGFRLGYLFEKFYDQIMAAPVPDDLTEEELTVYFEELAKLIRPLIERAIYVYQKNIAFSQRLHEDNEWVRETEERLDKLQRLLKEDPFQAPKKETPDQEQPEERPEEEKPAEEKPAEQTPAEEKPAEQTPAEL